MDVAAGCGAAERQDFWMTGALSRISSLEILPLCSGAHQFALRWKTVN